MATFQSLAVSRVFVVKSAGSSSGLADSKASTPVLASLSSRSAFLSGTKLSGAASTSGRAVNKGPLQVEARRKYGQSGNKKERINKNMGGFRGNAQDQQQKQQQSEYELPELNAKETQFALYVTSDSAKGKWKNQWLPITVVTGGSSAKALVQATTTDIGKKMGAENTLTRNMGNMVYQDGTEIEALARKNYAPLEDCTDMTFGYKLLDPSIDVKEQMKPAEGTVTAIPSKAELDATKPPAEKLGEGFKGIQKGLKGIKGNLGL